MRINNNLMAMNTHRQLGINNGASAKSVERLSSGLRINKAGDDAAGLAISEKMRGQIRGLNQASRNSQDAISLVQTAEGALNETQAILQRMRELAVQSANDTNEVSDRSAIQNEMEQLTSEINRISETTEFNNKALLNGNLAISNDGKKLDGLAGFAVNMSNLVVNAASTLETGDYSLKVTKTVTNEVSTAQVSSDVALDVTDVKIAAENTNLAEGSYKVIITEESAKQLAAPATDATGVLNTTDDNQPISVLSDTVTADGDYIVRVTKSIEQEFNEIDAGGITLTADTDGAISAAGNYTIRTNAVVNNADITDAGGLMTAVTGPISNLEIETNSTYAAADGYKIVLEQSGTSAVADGSGTMATTADFTIAGTKFDLNNVAIDLTSLGSTVDLTVGANQDATVTAIQDLINAKFDGTANGGQTFTVSNNGGTFTITSDQGGPNNQADITNATGAAVTAGLLLANGVNSGLADTADNVSMTFKLLNGTGDLVESTSASFTNTSGSTAIKLGDFSFDIDNQLMYASDVDPTDSAVASTFAGEVLDFGGAAGALEYELTITADDGSTKTTSLEQNAVVGNDTPITLSDLDAAGDGLGSDQVITLDYNTANFIPGNAYAVAVSDVSSYDIDLVADADGSGTVNGAEAPVVGTTITLSGVDINTPGNITNVQVGGAGTGILVDFDKTVLQGLADGASSLVTFELETDNAFTAQVLSANGDAVAGYSKTTLDGSGALSAELSIGEDIKLDYIGTSLAEGDIYFSVNGGTTTFNMDLIDDNADVLDTQSFTEGDNVSFADYGVSIGTAAGVANAATTTFAVEDGTIDKSIKMQIGANTGQNIAIDIADMGAKALKVSSDDKTDTVVAGDYTASYKQIASISDGINNTSTEFALDVSTHENATAAVQVITDALTTVSDQRAKMGAVQNRLEHTIKNLDTSAENLQASESRIRDVDMAKEMMEFTKNNILTQAAQAMLAQANQQPQGVLQLLR